MIPKTKYLISLFIFSIFVACSQKQIQVQQTIDALPSIFPDYIGVTIPQNIAPLHFRLTDSCVYEDAYAIFETDGERIEVKAKKEQFAISSSMWQKLMKGAAGKSINITVLVKADNKWIGYSPFSMHVAKEPIDPYIAYRLIEPGYEVWNEMGIYQRCLENFTEEAIIENKLTNNSCINCHSFCMNNPEQMLFHQRANYAGTYLIANKTIEKLNPQQTTDKKITSLVYPYWHPSGNYIAFSTNDTKQDFHLSDPNRIEVFDNHSDILLYDIKKNVLFTAPTLSSDTNLETFPAFSPDGMQLYFCSASNRLMPESYREMKYSLVRVAFNPVERSFGKTDTLYNANDEGRSAKFPRISPDGKYLLYTLSDYGNFSIWHKDADLRMIDLQTLQTDSLSAVNSDDVESYHSWSTNSRWFVFSSRRMDGLYTRPYICYVDKNGKTGKPFLLPQKHADYYTYSLFSFNIPELIKDKVEMSTYDLMQYILAQ